MKILPFITLLTITTAAINADWLDDTIKYWDEKTTTKVNIPQHDTKPQPLITTATVTKVVVTPTCKVTTITKTTTTKENYVK